MSRVRGAEFVTGKSEGSVDIVIASVWEGGVCWTRQLEMLFTAPGQPRRNSGLLANLLSTTLWHDFGGHSSSAFTNSGVAR
jgi:hypothetical protein